MTAYLRSPLTAVWLILTSVTFASWWLGASGDSHRLGVSLSITGSVVAIALLKTRLVFWYFMEVRSAPAWLRWTCDGWLAGLAVVIFALYSCGS